MQQTYFQTAIKKVEEDWNIKMSTSYAIICSLL